MSNINIPASITTGYTHCGVFHADETMATAMLRILYPDMKVVRVAFAPKDIRDDEIVYDIGNGEYDHHLGDKARKNGVPYAACGLIWRDFGPSILKKLDASVEAMGQIDGIICQPIDLRDNRGSQRPKDVPMMELSDCIAALNPTWEEDAAYTEAAFNEAVEFCTKILLRQIERVKSSFKAAEVVKHAIENTTDGIMHLERFVPWQSHLINSENPKAESILFVTYPSLRGGYNAQSVPMGNTRENKLLFPATWHGKSGEELIQLTGVADAVFCHKAGFLVSAKTLEGVTQLAKTAIAASN